MRNGHYTLPPIRPELQAAYDELDARSSYFDYAVCRTWDNQEWEVITKQGNIYGALDDHYIDHDEAMASGVAWLLKKLDDEPTADEANHQALWEKGY